MKTDFFNKFDYFLLICVIFLTGVGVLFIYSSGINSDGILVSNEYIKQIIWAVLGLIVLVPVALFDYRKLNRYSIYFYFALILLLIYTRFFGKYVNGAKSWIGFKGIGIQPSELGKPFFILFLARYLDKSYMENSRKRFFLALAVMLIPFGLILIQPDMGTASVYIPIFLVMCFIANIPIRYLLTVLIGGLLSIVFIVLPVWQSEIYKSSVPLISLLTNIKLFIIICSVAFILLVVSLLGYYFFKKKYYYWLTISFGVLLFALLFSKLGAVVLQPYQIKRLIIFIDPYSDASGAGWNIIQSITAIGSGGLFGRGFLRGTQSHYRFLPQRSTDFIFSIFSEEMGFVGGIVLFLVYLSIFLRIIYIIKQTTNRYGCYIASGILGMMFYHFVVNAGMVIGIMPITGIPLPFLSYGGSSLITNMICIGLLMSINSRRLDFAVPV